MDDFGWGNVGYHRTDASPEVQTPTIDALVGEGIELDRHYVHMMCTPSRSALQSGRLPVHIITQLANPCDANCAIPRNMTGLAAKLKSAGYATHQVRALLSAARTGSRRTRRAFDRRWASGTRAW